MKISQSLIKAVEENDHCPKQIFYSFVEGKEIEPTEVMLIGRYFESELIGACRGGAKQDAKYRQINLKPSKSANKTVKVDFLTKRGHDCTGLTVKELDEKLQFEPSEYVNGEKLTAYLDCDELVTYSKDVIKSLGIDLENGQSQLEISNELLKGTVDHRNNDIMNPDRLANYDVKWTATAEDDRWNGWGNPEDKHDAWTQAIHYSLISYDELGYYPSFYFLIFGKSKWVKVLRYRFNESQLEDHKNKIAYTASKIREYTEQNYKGNGSFNKCLKCDFNEICSDAKKVPEIQTIEI